MQRYFIQTNAIQGSKIIITGQDYHHIKNVMRMKLGNQVMVCTEKGQSYLAEIIAYTDTEVLLSTINQLQEQVELPVMVTIAQGMVRREKTEEVIRRISELGASSYVSVMMERSIVKIKENDNKKITRYKMIAKEASEQAHRTKIMTVMEPMLFTDFLHQIKQYDLCLVAYEEQGRANDRSLPRVLKGFTGKTILIVIGPEGGFGAAEIKALATTATLVGLGPRILRTETAPLYLMSAISYYYELGETNEN